MKTIFLAVATTSIFLAACNSGKTTNSSTQDSMIATQVPADRKDDAGEKKSSPASKLINDYLQLKNALTKDNTGDAAASGKAIATDFEGFDKAVLDEKQKKSFEDIADDGREHGEHIGKSAGNISHQREHFEMLSKDVYDLVKLVGAGQSLYVDHCPMYNNNKGANWLSETKSIQNPYLGQKMANCGVVKEELK
ncbi:DUF3347 domain-containing protein (plasmid) [Mucilaginibacter robiniae]|jgi:pectate lyase|uniref:DUF3347 domain-containing protein n=1 Tax=Mucilaginibacter robiniae TaxID=2728022 RepID=A0A7L5E6D0_9SPHI|nr:DUF3347 domain-containing protein [Mucilaginibacter robiniae]QJD98595.1 DUF3347 domain-containing protein [Mucilaginibacter robiniae]